MDNVTELLVRGAAGAGSKTYVDDVFSTDLYLGNGSNRTITNNIDLAGEGGLVWVKGRNVGYYNNLQDNVSGLTGTAKYLTSNEDYVANATSNTYVTGFNNNGFDVGVGGQVNINNYDFASWTFRRQKGFFDIVSWTGNGSNRTIAHNLGSVPGCIMIKRTDAQATWIVYHKGLGYYTTDPSDYAMQGLDNLAAKVNYNWLFQSAATATGFEIGTGDFVNGNGGSFVAYIFADDDQQFGENGNQSIIKCGYYTGSGSPNLNVNLGFEPQWLLIKNADRANTNWCVFDSMRGISTGYDDALLHPNSAGAESSPVNFIDLTPTGFKVQTTQHDDTNQSGEIFLYIAIRRPDGYVGKPVEDGTKVFGMTYGSADSATPQFRTPTVDVNDFTFYWQPASGGSRYCGSRLLEGRYWLTNSSGGTQNDPNEKYDYMNGFGSWTSNGTSYLSYVWKRHAGFDVVTYIGTGDNSNAGPNSTSQIISHNLGRVPEMIWVKCRSTGYNWFVYHKGQNGGTNPQNYYLRLNHTDAETHSVAPYTNAVWNNTAPTSTHFSLGPGNDINANNDTYMAMLFASVDGVSKCGYYDGTGSAGHVITTGFLPRLLIIKRVNGANSWFLYDTIRGLGSGNDPYMQLENTNAQASGSGLDVFATSSTGFTINQSYSSVNASGGKYIYYAHA